jgi:hypothetical protein
MNEAHPVKQWRRALPYLTGAVLSYVLTVITCGRAFCAGAYWDFGVACFGALCFWPFVAFAHVGLQLLLAFILTKARKKALRFDWVILNLPVMTLMCVSLVEAQREPKRAFRFFLADPIPSSVRIKQFGRQQGIGEPMNLFISFEIAKPELEAILRKGGYAPAVIDTRTPTTPTQDIRGFSGAVLILDRQQRA